MPTRCFWVEDASFERVSLRRFAGKSHGDCSIHGFHTAQAFVVERGGRSCSSLIMPEHATRVSGEYGIEWPTLCDCGYQFGPEEEHQVFTERLYVRPETGERMPLADFPPGAMWDAEWMGEYYKGPDGRAITVRLPNGRDWLIDSRASNCGLPDDHVHQCWVRHGEPPDITVNKDGNTCEAGAGSIWSRQGEPDDWHGFLTGGVLHLAGEAPSV